MGLKMSQTQIDTSKLTPMMRQFFDLKSRVEDSILFFRMGDFYEIFGDDAEEVAPKLELVLTARERGDKNKIPFCGVPHHSARNYWLKLLKMGYRVAIADQVENPEEAKGLVKRDIVQVYTPGCIEDLEGLDSDSPNYLMVVFECPQERRWVMSLVDVSTGEFRCGELESFEDIYNQVQKFRPRELVCRRFIQDDVKELLENYLSEFGLSIASLPEGVLRDDSLQKQLINDKLSVDSIESLPCGKVLAGDTIVAATLAYLESIHATTCQFLSIAPLHENATMVLDETVIRDLEIFETARRRQSKGSLFREINRCRTPMGARLLRKSLVAPFTEAKAIQLAFEYIRTSDDKWFTIFSDSLSCLQSIKNMNIEHPFILDILKQYCILTRQNKIVEFCWIPSHIGISGNTKANKAAKDALNYNVTLFTHKTKLSIKRTWSTQTATASNVCPGAISRISCNVSRFTVFT